MAITVEGVRLNTTLEALEQGEGFIVKVNTNWSVNRQDTEQRNAQRKAQELGILGSRLNGHNATYSGSQYEMDQAIGQFETDITQFISDWNSGVYSGSV